MGIFKRQVDQLLGCQPRPVDHNPQDAQVSPDFLKEPKKHKGYLDLLGGSSHES